MHVCLVKRGGQILARSRHACIRSAIEGSIHRCRHYFGTELLRAGVSVRVIQTLMRHESLATTANYLGVDEDERVAAVRALAA